MYCSPFQLFPQWKITCGCTWIITQIWPTAVEYALALTLSTVDETPDQSHFIFTGAAVVQLDDVHDFATVRDKIELPVVHLKMWGCVVLLLIFFFSLNDIRTGLPVCNPCYYKHWTFDVRLLSRYANYRGHFKETEFVKHNKKKWWIIRAFKCKVECMWQ